MCCMCALGCATYDATHPFGDSYYKKARAYFDAKDYDKAIDASVYGQKEIQKYIDGCRNSKSYREESRSIPIEEVLIERLKSI